ncbi:MAG: LysR family glycine cleavage system transcriptional activator [Cellvibrionaceae bacterium]|jgi:LysR family glycine cleavage system transcriptional activator
MLIRWICSRLIIESYGKARLISKQTILFHATGENNSSITAFARRSISINRLPPLNALKSFEAAARRGSFQAAAEELFVTPSAISHQIKSLEEFLGLELFIRQPRRVLLTHAGEDYLRSIQKALGEIDLSTQKLIIAAHQSGALNLSVAPAFLTRWLLPRISEFHDSYPDVTLEISAANGLIDFNHEETDMAVYFGDGKWQDIERQLLRHYQQRPVCHPNLVKNSEVKQPADIMKHTLLHVNKRRADWAKWFHQQGVPYKESVSGMYFSSGALTTAAAINGLGFALADLGFVSEEIDSGKLIAPLDAYLKTDRSFYLVYQKNRPPSYSMKVFQDWITEKMKKDLVLEYG